MRIATTACIEKYVTEIRDHRKCGGDGGNPDGTDLNMGRTVLARAWKDCVRALHRTLSPLPALSLVEPATG